MSKRGRNGTLALIASIALLFGLVSAAPAQDAPAADDPFDTSAFDAATEGAAAGAGSAASGPGAVGQSTAARVEYLVGGTAVASASAFAAPAFDGYAASSSLGGKVFAKVAVPDYGALYISYNISQALFSGLSGAGKAALAPALDLSNPRYSLSELHYSLDFGKVLFVRAGKQLIAWGPSFVWTPVDFINLQKADAFASFDQRQGKPGLRLHLPLGKANAFAFADFSGLVSGGLTHDPLDTVNIAGRLDAIVGGFELGLTAFGGRNSQAKLGVDFSGDLLGFAAYGEVGLSPAYSSYEYALRGSLGLSRSLGELRRWTVSAEAFYNSAGADLGGNIPAMLASTPLYMGVWYAYAALEAREFLSPSLITKISGLANFTDLSCRLELSETFDFPRAVPLTASLSWVGGGPGKEFTVLAGDGSFSLSVQTRFEF
ncbi:MAG: hypothetical protein WCL50_05140 [Spirochaetota bacterium]